jgi:hypothetical protein
MQKSKTKMERMEKRVVSLGNHSETRKRMLTEKIETYIFYCHLASILKSPLQRESVVYWY